MGTAFWAVLGGGSHSIIYSTWNIWTASCFFFFFLRLAFDTLIQLSNLFLGTTLFESGREWGFILVIAAAYFEGENLKSMNSAPSRNWLLMAAVGRKSGT